MSNRYPALHNAMWPGLVGKGPDSELLRLPEVAGQRLDQGKAAECCCPPQTMCLLGNVLGFCVFAVASNPILRTRVSC